MSTNLTISMALENMREAVERVDELEREYEQRRQEALRDRNVGIRDAVANGYPVARLARETGLSRARIYQIVGAGSKE